MSYRDHEYWFQSGTFTWDQAETYCVNTFGGHLASFHSDQEYDAVINALTTAHWAEPRGWIGLSDSVVEGTWTWSDGTSVVWTKWGAGQPDNGGGGEDCAETNYVFPEWNDNPCSVTVGAICKSNALRLGVHVCPPASTFLHFSASQPSCCG